MLLLGLGETLLLLRAETDLSRDVAVVLANRKLVCDKAGFDALMARIAK